MVFNDDGLLCDDSECLERFDRKHKYESDNALGQRALGRRWNRVVLLSHVHWYCPKHKLALVEHGAATAGRRLLTGGLFDVVEVRGNGHAV